MKGIRCQMPSAILILLGYIHGTTSFAPAPTITSFVNNASRGHASNTNHFTTSVEQVSEIDVATVGSSSANVFDDKDKCHKDDDDALYILTAEQEEFFNSLDSKMYGALFLDRCRDLQLYKNENGGSCHVPKRYAKNPKLGNWVNKTRQMYRKFQEGKPSSITQERIDLLNDMGFIWSLVGMAVIHDKSTMVRNNFGGPSANSNANMPTLVLSKDVVWMKSYNQMKEYMESHDVTTAPPSTKLGVWAARQRREYLSFTSKQKSSMTPERIQLLNDINFDWSPRDTKWNMRIKELLEYKSRFGDCCVPVQWAENPPLGRWVSTQRKYYKLYMSGKPTRISKERIIQLSDLGFVWNRWEDAWNDDLCQLDSCEDILKRR